MNPMRRSFLLVVSTLLLFGCGQTANNGTPGNSRPNIVLIMAEDMGYYDLGCYGGEIETPVLDSLAANGLRFTRFYNAARCCPTRASLLTGLYPHQAGMGKMVSSVSSSPAPGPYQGFLNHECVTLAEALKPAGYATYMSGKWHVGEKPAHWPRKRGFDRYWGLISGASSYYELLENDRMKRQIVLDDSLWAPPAEGFYMTDATTTFATDFLEDHDPATPFLLYVAYTAPHWPLHALPDDIRKYKDRYAPGWDSLRRERYARQLQMGLFGETPPALSPRLASVAPWDSTENQAYQASLMEVYAAMVDRMDQGIGKLVEALKQKGVYDNTLILFLSDNGGSPENIAGRKLDTPGSLPGSRGSYVAYGEPWAFASNTPFRLYKQYTHEGGSATPLIAHWPKGLAVRGALTHQAGHITDIMATCLDLAGATYPDTLNGQNIRPLVGKSLLPVLQGQEKTGHETLFWEHYGNKAVLQGKWKLVKTRVGPWELYDLETDRSELNNLVAIEVEKARELEGLYDAWASGNAIIDE